ncbi:MAG: SAM-dependent methyltransferase, partial [Actinomycetota bacterium]
MSIFDAGERALFIDRKGRRYLVTLRAGLQFHTHDGFVEHDTVIGSSEGARVFSSTGIPFVVVRPS